MNNNYIPLVPNSKIKFFKSSLENTLENTLENKTIRDTYYNTINQRFNSWLESPLYEKDHIIQFNQIKYKKKLIFNEDGGVVKKNVYIIHFINTLTDVLNKKGYSINNNKQFRNTVTSFIYKNSL
jgi:hypothetical protein